MSEVSLEVSSETITESLNQNERIVLDFDIQRDKNDRTKVRNLQSALVDL